VGGWGVVCPNKSTRAEVLIREDLNAVGGGGGGGNLRRGKL